MGHMTNPSPADSLQGQRRQRVTFLINSMEGGGAERALANLLRYLLPFMDGQDVDLLLLDNLPMEQTIPDGLPVTSLDGDGKLLRSFLQVMRHWADPANRPDICVSFLARSNVVNVWLARRFGHRAIISERVHTSSHIAASRIAPALRLITRMTYPRADHVIAVSMGVKQDLSTRYGVPSETISVIGNAIDAKRLNSLAEEPLPFPLPDDFLLGMGRLVPNKNFALLLDAYAAATRAPPLVLLGQGPEEHALRAQAIRLGIENRVHFCGFVENPYPILARARALISSSRAEGFPNTIIEAITLGCPVIATDCPYGPADVLSGPVSSAPPWPKTAHGILIAMEDSNAMTAAIDTLCNDGARADFEARARRRAHAYGHEAVVKTYTNLILHPEDASKRARALLRDQDPVPSVQSDVEPRQTRRTRCTNS